MSVAIFSSNFFASQRVSVTDPDRRELCRSLANSLAKPIKNHCKNQSEIDPRKHLGAPKIDSKSIPGPSPDTPWRPRVSRRRLGSVSGASWSVPGAPRKRPEGRQGYPGTPERAPWRAWEHTEDTKIDTKSRPGAQKSSFLCAVSSRCIVGAIFRRF